MTYEYEYTREYGDVIHSNPDEYNISHREEASNIAKDILTAIPGLDFITCCIDTLFKVCCERELTGEEQTTLASTITTHKAVDDWPPA